MTVSHIRKKAYLTANLAVIGFAAAAILGKTLGVSAELVVWGRTLFAALTLGTLLLCFRRLTPPALSATFWTHIQLFVSGIILCTHWYAFFETVNSAGVSTALLTFACFPLFVILIQTLRNPKSLNIWDLLAAAMIILGIYIIVPSFQEHQLLVGWLWGFGSAALFAILALQNETLIKHYNTFQVSFWQNAVACVIVTLATIRFSVLENLSSQQWILLAICGVLCTAIAHTLLMRTFNALPAVKVSFIVNLEPVYGLLLAFWLLDESIAMSSLIGGAIVILAIIINSLSHGEPAGKAPPKPAPTLGATP